MYVASIWTSRAILQQTSIKNFFNYTTATVLVGCLQFSHGVFAGHVVMNITSVLTPRYRLPVIYSVYIGCLSKEPESHSRQLCTYSCMQTRACIHIAHTQICIHAHAMHPHTQLHTCTHTQFQCFKTEHNVLPVCITFQRSGPKKGTLSPCSSFVAQNSHLSTQK